MFSATREMIVVAVALPFRASAVPLGDLLQHLDVVGTLLAGSSIGAFCGAAWATTLKSRTLYRVIALLLLAISVVLVLGHGYASAGPAFDDPVLGRAVLGRAVPGAGSGLGRAHPPHQHSERRNRPRRRLQDLRLALFPAGTVSGRQPKGAVGRAGIGRAAVAQHLTSTIRPALPPPMRIPDTIPPRCPPNEEREPSNLNISALPSKLAHLKICHGRLPGGIEHAAKPV